MTASPEVAHRISVVVPTYNRAHSLERAVTSVLSQTVPVSQVVVVDDGSTDATADTARRLTQRDPRVEYVRQDNAGAPAARNRGLALATGQLVAFQDSDDEWHPRFIEHLLPVVAGSPRTVAYSSHTVRRLDGSSYPFPPAHVARTPHALLRANTISTQTVLLHRSLVVEAGGFDTRLEAYQDWDLWLTLRRTADFVHVPIALATLHRSTDSISEGDGSRHGRALRVIVTKHWRAMSARPTVLVRHAVRGLAASRGRTSPSGGRHG